MNLLIEHDEKIEARAFDLWLGMAAGSQAQGSWQNTKGDRAEVAIKDLIDNARSFFNVKSRRRN